MFREAARDYRDIDCIAVLRSNEETKNLKDFTTACKKLGLNGLLVSTEIGGNCQQILDSLNFPNIQVNVSRGELAKLLGRTKVLLHPSSRESCSLVLYEAMNAGAVVVGRRVGAIEEQMGSLGICYDDPSEIVPLLDRVFQNASLCPTSSELIQRGTMFDRITIGPVIDARLAKIEDKL
jgi:glycosyltransferase involved in cell wall biosynthesis